MSEKRSVNRENGSRSPETSILQSRVESGPDSAPSRRQFFKKAAAITAVGAGGILLKRSILPESSASSNIAVTTSACFVPQPGSLAVWSGCTTLTDCVPFTKIGCNFYGASATLSGLQETIPCCCINPLGSVLTVRNTITTTCSHPVGLAGFTEDLGRKCWPLRTVGVVGSANAGAGVTGSSIHGTGVLASSLSYCCPPGTPISEGVPLAAHGAVNQEAFLQKWISPGNPESVVTGNGFFGIGTTVPETLLCVNGNISASKVGLGTTSKTTFAVDGSISGKVVFEKTNYCMGKLDFGVVAQAAITVKLPAANTATGMVVFIKKADATSDGPVTVTAIGMDKIECSSSKSLPDQYDSLTLMSNGGAPGIWYVLFNGT